MTTEGFYTKVIQSLLSTNKLQTTDKILVICAGSLDRKIFMENKFLNVTISNLDVRRNEKAFDPYQWSFQDAENLDYSDQNFDWVVVHAGLHHCYSPHRAMLEMLRVASKGILVFEAKEGLLFKLGKSVKLVRDYEFEGVVANDYKFGGVADLPVPNFIYRWTEREIEKTINSVYPAHQNPIKFFYGLRIPIERFLSSKSASKRLLGFSLAKIGELVFLFLPKQGNQFAFSVTKSKKTKQWITENNGQLILDSAYVIKNLL